jgi:hypothetical protein
MKRGSAAKSKLSCLPLFCGLIALGAFMWLLRLMRPSYGISYILQSPAGSQDVIYCRDSGDREVVSYNLRTREKTVLGRTSVLVDPYVRLPNDEGWLGDIYSSDGRSQIYILDKRFKPARKVIDSQQSDTMPSLIGGSRSFVFWRARQIRSGAWQERWTDFDLFCANLDDAKPKLIAATNVSDVSSVSPNPLGSRIVYSTRERMDRKRIYALDLNSKTPVELLPTARYNSYPTYSSDGLRVVFASDRATAYKYEVWTTTDKGDNLLQVTSLNRRCSHPVFIGKARTIAFIVDESELWLCNEDGTGLLRVE